MNDLETMGRVVEALRPWLGHLVVVGGWAHQLHRYHPLARPPAHAPLRTRDADVAFSPTAPITGNMAAALAAAGFREEMLGEHTPPVTRYRLGEKDQGFSVEFLAPRSGSGRTRSGRTGATLAMGGVTAQRLRHVELLLAQPWPVRLDAAQGFPIAEPAEVLVANPVSFIAQRLLIHGSREPRKKSQDVLYIHDTLELFGRSLEALRVDWRDRIRPTLASTTAARVVRHGETLFGALTDVIRDAARIPQDRTLEPERLRRVGALGLERVFARTDRTVQDPPSRDS